MKEPVLTRTLALMVMYITQIGPGPTLALLSDVSEASPGKALEEKMR